jgi:hypothetical protein
MRRKQAGSAEVPAEIFVLRMKLLVEGLQRRSSLSPRVVRA